MIWLILLISSLLTCPSTMIVYRCAPPPVYYYTQCEPVPMVSFAPVVVQTMAPLPMGIVSDVAPPVAAPVADAVATETASASVAESDEVATENVAAQLPPLFAPRDMSLDWGVATIGNGTLYPTPQYVIQGGGGAFWPGPSNNGTTPTPPPTFNFNPPTCSCPTCPPDKPGPGSEPVPEPLAIVTWIFVVVAIVCGRRLIPTAELQPIPVSAERGMRFEKPSLD